MSTTLVKDGAAANLHPGARGRGSRGPSLLATALIFLLLSAILRSVTNMDQEAEQYHPSMASQEKVIGGDWLAGMLLGFREMVADLMWIQVDSDFQEGRYDKILPICYVITAMDPGWVDVYATGAWHLGYNFGDRRLVPAAIDFDRLGVKNNPKNYDVWYELGWMEWTRGYLFSQAAHDFAVANRLGLAPTGKRHALAHALEDSGDLDGARRAWEKIEREERGSPDLARKQLTLLNLRRVSRKDLWKHPVLVHLDLKITRKGPRVLHFEGVTNLPKYSKVFYDLRDVDWKQREKESLSARIQNYTEYSQTDTTLQPTQGIFDGQQIDFYQGTLRIHQGDKQYNQFPTEPPLPIRDGHMIIGNGSFHGDIDMAKNPDQYPLKSDRYILTFFVNPRMEPIGTQDLISWDGSGMSGPLVHREGTMNVLTWQIILRKKDIE